jgi:hypothetical protein
MPQRLRKLIGTVLLVAFVTAYIVVAVTIGDFRIRDASWPIQAIYFLVAGLAWVLPAGLIIRWMQRPESA